MQNNEKKVIFLNQVSSPYIEQAIIVLKGNANHVQVPNNIIKEAERIVSDYAKEYFSNKSFENTLEEVGLNYDNKYIDHDCDDLSEDNEPTFEFLKQPKRKRVFAFLKRNIFAVFLLLAIVGAICAMAFFAVQLFS